MICFYLEFRVGIILRVCGSKLLKILLKATFSLLLLNAKLIKKKGKTHIIYKKDQKELVEKIQEGTEYNLVSYIWWPFCVCIFLQYLLENQVSHLCQLTTCSMHGNFNFKCNMLISLLSYLRISLLSKLFSFTIRYITLNSSLIN